MAITISENIQSRRSTIAEKPSIELTFMLRGTSDDLAAKTFILANTLEEYDGLVRESIELEPEWVDTTTANGLWRVRVRYGPYPQVGESTFSFDTSGGTQHITQSIETVGRYALPDKTPSDFKGAIGVTNDGVEGVDIAMPVYNWSETHYFPDSFVTLEYRGILKKLTARTNDKDWGGMEKGEVLFLGACGSKRGLEDWAITFKFAASSNQTDLTIGDITGIEKKGWEYLWVRYVDDTDIGSASWVKTPKEVYVERVYKEGDFILLGIGK